MNLTQNQLRAVTTDSRDVLCIAGAGSGKTAVLAGRIAHLLANGATPDQMLVLTFTRRAAHEMTERIRAAVGRNDAMRGAMVGTFHSVALRILREHGDKLGYNPDTLTIITPDDSDLLLAQACRDLGYLKLKDKWAAGMSMTRVRSALDAWYTGMALDKPDARLDVAVSRYRDMLFHMNALDFGAMLRECNRLLETCPEVLNCYREKIKFVFLDEAQDQDSIQFITHNFFLGSARYFIVGDPRQTIYGWRGARPDLMQSNHLEAEVIDLCENFRSGDDIVNLANRLIAHNFPELPPLIGATGRRGCWRLFTGRSSAIIGEAALCHRRDNYQWSDIAILARNHAILKRLEWKAKEAGVPVYRVGKAFDITDTDEFKNVLAALRLIVNPRDDLAFMRLVFYVFGHPQEEYAALRAEASKSGRSVFSAHADFDNWRGDELTAAILSGDPEASVLQMCGFVGACLPTSREYAAVTTFWAEHCLPMSVREALEWYALRDSQDDVNEDNAVTLMTVHASKGLEFPVVILAGLNEGTFPSSRALREPGGVEAERNVAYVGMTRARERLILHWRSPDDQAERKGGADPQSRFIGEATGAVTSEGALRAKGISS